MLMDIGKKKDLHHVVLVFSQGQTTFVPYYHYYYYLHFTYRMFYRIKGCISCLAPSKFVLDIGFDHMFEFPNGPGFQHILLDLIG